MERISAAGNLTIEMQPGQWRLLTDNGEQEYMVLEAVTGQPLHYTDLFATKRRLPEDGSLPVQFIQQVVLGWSNEDEAWHLGLVFDPELSRMRGSRWCELARWPDPDTNVFNTLANQAGRNLAQTIARPFSLLQPEVKPKLPPPPPLPALPLHFDQWRLEVVDNEEERKKRLAAELGRAKATPPTLQLRRSTSWSRGKLLRGVWYLLLASAYLGLSVLSLNGTLALPTPEFLPYIGLAAGAIFVILALVQIAQTFLTSNRILIEPEAHGAAAGRGQRDRWRVRREDIQAVYVSQVVNRNNIKRGKKPAVLHGELNLYLRDESFRRILEQPQPDYDHPVMAEAEVNETVAPLTQANVVTPLQAAALYIAATLNAPCYYDLRVK
ncbi:MAG: hypothetical protein K8I60_05860 [Anaerolineae bacterium]|nr:hypothetical protein [Anaerolineae bacterium]